MPLQLARVVAAGQRPLFGLDDEGLASRAGRRLSRLKSARAGRPAGIFQAGLATHTSPGRVKGSGASGRAEGRRVMPWSV